MDELIMDLQAFIAEQGDMKDWWDAPSEDIPPWNKGMKTGPHSLATKQKMRLAKLGKKRGPYGKTKGDSEETKRRKSEAAKKRWLNNTDMREALVMRNKKRFGTL